MYLNYFLTSSNLFAFLYLLSSFICFSTDFRRNERSKKADAMQEYFGLLALSWKHTWLTLTKIDLSNINFLAFQEYRIVPLKIGAGSWRWIKERISVASSLLDNSRPACKNLTNPTEFCSLSIRFFTLWKKQVSEDRQWRAPRGGIISNVDVRFHP